MSAKYVALNKDPWTNTRILSIISYIAGACFGIISAGIVSKYGFWSWPSFLWMIATGIVGFFSAEAVVESASKAHDSNSKAGKQCEQEKGAAMGGYDVLLRDVIHLDLECSECHNELTLSGGLPKGDGTYQLNIDPCQYCIEVQKAGTSKGLYESQSASINESRFKPIHEPCEMIENPQAIEFLNAQTGETYIHTFGTVFYDENERCLDTKNLMRAGITHWRLRPDVVDER